MSNISYQRKKSNHNYSIAAVLKYCIHPSTYQLCTQWDHRGCCCWEYSLDRSHTHTIPPLTPWAILESLIDKCVFLDCGGKNLVSPWKPTLMQTHLSSVKPGFKPATFILRDKGGVHPSTIPHPPLLHFNFICLLCKLPRSTFYLHFFDIYFLIAIDIDRYRYISFLLPYFFVY